MQPGDILELTALGEFDYHLAATGTPLTNMVGVFAMTNDYDRPSGVPPGGDIQRVNTAIAAGINYPTINASQGVGGFPLGQPTDIPEDFSIAGTVRVRVPQGARCLFVGADDEYWSDNSDSDGDFKLRVVRSEIAGDINGDGMVDAADAGFIFGNWGTVPPGDVTADLNDDGFIDAADAGILFGQWTGDSSAAAVPEPRSGLLVWMAGFGLIPFLRRACPIPISRREWLDSRASAQRPPSARNVRRSLSAKVHHDSATG